MLQYGLFCDCLSLSIMFVNLTVLLYMVAHFFSFLYNEQSRNLTQVSWWTYVHVSIGYRRRTDECLTTSSKIPETSTISLWAGSSRLLSLSNQFFRKGNWGSGRRSHRHLSQARAESKARTVSLFLSFHPGLEGTHGPHGTVWSQQSPWPLWSQFA